MNIKQLALKIYSEEDKTLEIDVRDEGEVTASDITHDSDVEILNPTNSKLQQYLKVVT